MKPKRPINLDLRTLAFPPMAIASILHRISGIVLFVLMPFALYVLSLSLRSPEHFQYLHTLFDCVYYKFIFWAFGSALIYHVFAGIRHLLSDIGLGEHLHSARLTAYAVMGISVVSIIILGIMIW